MQINPPNYSQVFLTFVGLCLLVVVILLNHFHPRNQGIADITHGSVYKLNLSLAKQPQVTGAATGYLSSVHRAFTQGPPANAAPTPKLSDDNQPAPAPAIGDPAVDVQNCADSDANHQALDSQGCVIKPAQSQTNAQ